MADFAEPTTIGLSSSAHDELKYLVQDCKEFLEMQDAYRFAIALALAHGGIAPKGSGRTTIFNIGTLDPDRKIYSAVKALRDNQDEPIYHTAERLAEWGVGELYRLAASGNISFGDLMEEAKSLLKTGKSSVRIP